MTIQASSYTNISTSVFSMKDVSLVYPSFKNKRGENLNLASSPINVILFPQLLGYFT